MRRSLVKFSGPEASNHTPSLADFITTTSGFELSVHTSPSFADARPKMVCREGLGCEACEAQGAAQAKIDLIPIFALRWNHPRHPGWRLPPTRLSNIGIDAPWRMSAFGKQTSPGDKQKSSRNLASAAHQAQHHHEQVDEVDVERKRAHHGLAAGRSGVIAGVIHPFDPLGIIGRKARKDANANNRNHPV